MQIVPQLQGKIYSDWAPSFNLAAPLYIQPVLSAAFPVSTESPTSSQTPQEAVQVLENTLNALASAGSESQNIQWRLRNLLGQLANQSNFVSDSTALVEILLKELLLRCKQVHPVEVWQLLRNKGCQFLGQHQATILQSLIVVLRAHTVLPRKTLIELIVSTCEANNARVSKTAVGRVVQLLYRSGCFIIHKDADGLEEASLLAQQTKNTRMELRKEYAVYDTLRRKHDALIVQWAHEEGLYLPAERWSQMLYQDKVHKNFMQSIVEQAKVPLSRWIDTLYANARSVPEVSNCSYVLQQYAALFDSNGALKPLESAHVLVALRCVAALAQTYVTLLGRPPLPSQRPIASFADNSPKGRPLYGNRSVLTASPRSTDDDASVAAMNSAQPVHMSPHSTTLADDEDRDSDFDERMSPGPNVQAPQVPLKVMEQWMTGGSNSNSNTNTNSSSWNAWLGPQNLISGTKSTLPGDAYDSNAELEDSFIVPFINSLIAEDSSKDLRSAAALANNNSTSAKSGKAAFSRTVSTTTAENLMGFSVSSPSCGFRSFPTFFRTSSYEDPNSLLF